MLSFKKTALVGALVLASLMPAHGLDTASGRAALESLSGTYASTAPEPWYGGYGTRQFTFDRGTWSLVFTHALDAAMQAPTFRFRTKGPYEIGAASATVAGAFEAVFYEDVKYVTLLTTDASLIAAFGFANCGL